LEAFDFRAANIMPFLRAEGVATAEIALDQLQVLAEAVNGHTGEVWSAAYELNTIWREARDCSAFLSNLRIQIIRAAVGVAGASSIDPAWLLWNSRTVRAIALTIQKEHATGTLPILADALEEAGCQDAVILTHCRESKEHPRHCWVVELLLDAAAESGRL